MKRVLSIVGVLALGACATDEPASTATYFHGMSLISGDGENVVRDAAMIVDGGEIVATGVVGEMAPPVGATEVDLSGRTVMPLLHSLHVHLGYLVDNVMTAENYSRASMVRDLETHARHGLGSVLSLGSDPGDTAFAIREEQKQGSLGGARLYTAGRGITSIGGWPTTIAAIAAAPQQVETEEEARAAVREMVDERVDAIKIWVDDAGGRVPKIAPELYTAAIDEAKRHGVAVLAHVYYLADAKGLVEAGVSGLAHSIRDAAVDAQLVAAMNQRDVFYVPTLVAHEAGFTYADVPAWVGEPAMAKTVSADVIAALKSDEFIAAQRANPGLPAARAEYALALENVKTLSDAGVRIGLGTDSGTTNRFPGYHEHRELELLVDAGLSPLRAIEAGTTAPAEILGIRNAGVLAAGSEASFLVVAGDPSIDIRATRDIENVYVRGEKIH